jgi:hypothetical protein
MLAGLLAVPHATGFGFAMFQFNHLLEPVTQVAPMMSSASRTFFSSATRGIASHFCVQ